MTAAIHRTAIVDSKAELGYGVEIGPYATVGPRVRLGDGVVVRAHAHIEGQTRIGPECQIFPFACVGEPPQDQKYHGEDTRLVIGARNLIREYVTLNPGTAGGGGLTSLGDDNLLMVGAHVAHDCHVGNHVIVANQAMLAGHVTVQDYAVIQASAGIGQFLRVGESAFVGAIAGVIQDVAPFCFVQGYPARVLKTNRIGMERRGFDAERIQAVERAFRLIFRSRLRPQEACERVRAELPDSTEAARLVEFIESCERGFTRTR